LALAADAAIAGVNSERGLNMSEIKLLHGDCLELMKTIPDNSIDLTVTSPPYDNLRTYNNSLAWTEDCWKKAIECLFRVTKIGGVVVWVVGDSTINGSETGTSFKQALYAISCGFNLYDTMIYQKVNAQPLNHRRYEQTFEYMFVFSKDKPQKVNLIKTSCKNAGKRNTGTARNNGTDYLSKKHGYGKPYKKEKPKTNIWAYTVGNVCASAKFSHPAKFPDELAKDHILSWSNEGDTILDCFAGSGTTGMAALATKRNAILIEKEQEYCEIIKRRIAAAQGLFAF
jgi:DNA modification methylase